MSVVERLHEACAEHAAGTTIAQVTIGLGYTAVTTAAGGLGLSYTMLESTACCTHVRSYRDFDGAPAAELLDYVLADNTLERSMGLALVNALNEPRARQMPDDDTPGGVFVEELGVRQGSRVAMVGHFPPVVRRLKEVGAEVTIVDAGQRMGDEASFLRELPGADVLIVTSTAILNGSLELFLDAASERTAVMLLGPTTPLLPEVWTDMPVRLLAGLVPVDHGPVVAAVRQGAGTPAILRHARKVYWARTAQRTAAGGDPSGEAQA